MKNLLDSLRIIFKLSTEETIIIYIKFVFLIAVNLQFLYRMKTNKLFEKLRRRESEEEDILAIQHIYLDEESRLLAVAASHHIILFSFSKKETTKDISVCCLLQLMNAFSMLIIQDFRSELS